MKSSFQKQLLQNHQVVVFTILCYVVTILYFNNIFSTFFYDDFSGVVSNHSIKNLSDLGGIFNSFNSRFVVGVSFALNYWIGGMSSTGYHLFNIFVHIFNAFAVYNLILLLMDLLSAKDDRRYISAALGAIFYATHPLATEPVNFITQRYVLLSTFFYLNAVNAYITWRLTDRWKGFILTLLLTVSAMFCKEMTVTLPIMYFVIEGCFFRVNKRNWLCILLLFSTILIIPITLLNSSHSQNITASIADHDPDNKGQVDIFRAKHAVGRWEYFLTEINVIRTYVRLVFMPVSQNFIYDYPVVSKIDLLTCLSAIFLLSILVFGVALLRRNIIASFAIFWFFLTLSVESSFIPIGHVIAEYRMYLPLVGWAVLLAWGSYQCRSSFRFAVLVGVLCVLIIFSILTFKRNQIWKDEVLLWRDAVVKSSRISRVYTNLGGALLRKGNYTEALGYLEKGLARVDDGLTDVPDLLIMLGNAHSNLGHFELAEQYYFQSCELIGTEEEMPYDVIGYFYYQNRMYDKAIGFFNKALKSLNNEYNGARQYYLVQSYLRTRRLKEAGAAIEVMKVNGDIRLSNQLFALHRRMVL